VSTNFTIWACSKGFGSFQGTSNIIILIILIPEKRKKQGKYFPHISLEMNIKFYLKQTRNDASILICIINGINQTLKMTTGYFVSERYWDKKLQCVKSSMQGADELNELLIQLKLEVLKQIRTYQLEGKSDWHYISTSLKRHLQKKTLLQVPEKVTATSINEVIPKFLLARSAEYKEETARKYLILQTVWKQFEEHRKAKVNISELSFSIMEEFRLYLLKVRNNRNDTIYKMLASLKSLIRWMIKNNYKVDTTCLDLRQKVKVKHEIVTLSEQEIAKLLSVELEEDTHIKIRDCFMFMLYTGQRYSDMQQLKPSEVVKDMWKFQSVKTGKDMLVPLVGWSRVAFEVASKYSFLLPNYAPQYFNREIKKICKLAGFNSNVVLKRYQGNKVILIEKPKYQFVSSHTARRTAVSLLLAKGVPPTVVMKLTGHSSIQTMMRYERTTNELLINALKSIKKKVT
jgi:integrase